MLFRFHELKTVYPILVGASVMFSLAMGLRQSLGLFMLPLSRDIGISVSDFTLAIAIQNLAWGVFQPLVGVWAVRIGFRPLMTLGSVLYFAGLLLLANTHGIVSVILGAGIAIGASMACTGGAVALAVTARVVPLNMRGMMLGVVSAVGSLGALFAAPIGQLLMENHGWRVGLLAFAGLALVMVPAALVAGRVDLISLPPIAEPVDRQSARKVIVTAFHNYQFVIMTLAFFVCGMQLVFLTTHLPSYMQICGLDPMLGAQALGVIGCFNIIGCLFFGWAGDRWNKLFLLGLIYVVRSIALACYFSVTPTPTNTLIFAAIMGFLWLGVAPLIAGWLGEKFGLRWLVMLNGIAFVSHQFGSFLGAYGGGLAFDAFMSYTVALWFGISIGLIAGIVQAVSAFNPNHSIATTV
jgi:predicted MFS family arabinose efflux permease